MSDLDMLLSLINLLPEDGSRLTPGGRKVLTTPRADLIEQLEATALIQFARSLPDAQRAMFIDFSIRLAKVTD